MLNYKMRENVNIICLLSQLNTKSYSENSSLFTQSRIYYFKNKICKVLTITQNCVLNYSIFDCTIGTKLLLAYIMGLCHQIPNKSPRSPITNL